MKQKKLITLAKMVVLIILIYWIIASANWGEVLSYLQGAQWKYVLLFTFFHLLGLAFSAKKWALIAHWSEFSNPYFFYFKKYIIGAFINNFLPSFVGGDAYRIITLGKTPFAGGESGAKNYTQSSHTVVLDRLSGLVTIYIMSVFFGTLYIFAGERSISEVNIAITVLWLLAFVGIGFAYVLKKSIFGKRLVEIFPKKVHKYIKALQVKVSPSQAVQMFGWSGLFAVSGVALSHLMLFYAIGIEIDLGSFLSMIFIISILATVPISIGNIGVKEALYVFFFGFFGISLTACITVVLLSRVLQMTISFLAVPFYLMDGGTRTSDLNS